MVKQEDRELKDGQKYLRRFMKLKYLSKKNTWEFGKAFKQPTAFTDQYLAFTGNFYR